MSASRSRHTVVSVRHRNTFLEFEEFDPNESHRLRQESAPPTGHWKTDSHEAGQPRSDSPRRVPHETAQAMKNVKEDCMGPRQVSEQTQSTEAPDQDNLSLDFEDEVDNEAAMQMLESTPISSWNLEGAATTATRPYLNGVRNSLQEHSFKLVPPDDDDDDKLSAYMGSDNEGDWFGPTPSCSENQDTQDDKDEANVTTTSTNATLNGQPDSAQEKKEPTQLACHSLNFCTSCGFKVGSTHRFCMGCGLELCNQLRLPKQSARSTFATSSVQEFQGPDSCPSGLLANVGNMRFMEASGSDMELLHKHFNGILQANTLKALEQRNA